jgi:hypothetical protein
MRNLYLLIFCFVLLQVQVPLNMSGGEELLIYNQEKSVMGHVSPKQVAHIKCPWSGVSSYF